ncbi:hypothetical protein [Streptomyces sp. SID5785]|uniref:hypothetical protein n=1 Tax=Streptomyces sp. SID5785 TaxID=2690309 RepID=UPI001F29A468|nr:hypothetical protein [Streptomyces sp. SID5785]
MNRTRDRHRPRGVLAALCAGLVLTVLAALAPYVDRATTHLLADHTRAGYPTYTQTEIDSAVQTYLVVLTAVGVLGAFAWLATGWAVRAGRRGARPAATLLFGLGVTVGLAGLLTRDTSGMTGLPPALGWAGMAPCVAGLVAVVLLWRRPRRTWT